MKRVIKINIYIFTIFVTTLFSCVNSIENKKNSEKAITIFAASSLRDVMNEICELYDKKMHIKTRINFASSGTLARQIEHGANTDIYISANKQWAYYIDSSGYFIANSKKILAYNTLVLIADTQNTEIIQNNNIKKKLADQCLSIGNPEHVPAGKYAKQVLDYYGLYKSIDLIKTKDVRTALMVVEMGECLKGIVYRTDAYKSNKIRIIFSFPDNTHQPIEYVGGLCSNNKKAQDFFAFTTSEMVIPIWEKHGFILKLNKND